MKIADKLLRFLVNRIPIRAWKIHLRKQIFIKYNFYGKNNKVLIFREGEYQEAIYNLKDLKIFIEGDSNIIKIGEDVNFVDTSIEIIGNNNYVKLQNNCKFTSSIIDISGNTNKISICARLVFVNAIISMSEHKNTFIVKETTHKIKDANFYIEEGGRVFIGKNSELKNGGLHIVVNNNYNNKHKLIIGENVFLAKDTLIRTSDGHSLIDPVKQIAINEPQDIIIGDNVWIASRCIILKGSTIPNNSMVAAGSLINKPFNETNIMLAGVPAKIIRKNIQWDVKGYGKYMKDIEELKND